MIRRGTPEEFPRLVELSSLLAEPNPELLEWALEGAGEVLVSETADGVVGYVAAIVGPASAHVIELVVAPDVRRQGHGVALLDAMCDRLAGADKDRVTLAVEPDNEAARALYDRAGFEFVERKPGYFESGPAVMLAREL